MSNSITKIMRPVRRRLQKIAQFNTDADYRRRAKAVLLLNKGFNQSDVSNLLCASRTSIRKWVNLFQQFGESGLIPEQKGRQAFSITEAICVRLMELVQVQPREHGWFVSRWTSELLTNQINNEFETKIHSSTIRGLLPKLGIAWNRASPTLVYSG